MPWKTSPSCLLKKAFAIIEKMIEQAKKNRDGQKPSFFILGAGSWFGGPGHSIHTQGAIRVSPSLLCLGADVSRSGLPLVLTINGRWQGQTPVSYIDRAIQYLLVFLIVSSVLLTLIFFKIGWGELLYILRCDNGWRLLPGREMDELLSLLIVASVLWRRPCDPHHFYIL